ncbi:MAG: rRNA maturation RNase YbeY [Pseudomonadota bacterium]
MSTIDINTPCPHWQANHDAIARTVTRAALLALDQGAADAADAGGENFEISIVLADDAFVRDLNRQYRNIDRPTNVLSFPADDDDGLGPRLLGDVVLAYETVQREADAAGKPLLDHVSHLIIHGTLHLLGFDHEDEQEAIEMEALETAILARLGVADPYLAGAGRP